MAEERAAPRAGWRVGMELPTIVAVCALVLSFNVVSSYRVMARPIG